jgi:hypothetical protein
MILADLAAVGILRRDQEQSSYYSDRALAIAGQTGSGVVTRKLINLQSRILEER